MQKIKNQSGFGAIEVILVILLLVAIGAAGYFAYQNHNLATSKAKASTTQTTSTAQVANPKLQSSYVQSRVQTIYKAWHAEFGTGQIDTRLTDFQSKGYVTSGFVAAFQKVQASCDPTTIGGCAGPADPLLCGNGVTSNDYQTIPVDSVVISGTTATAKVYDNVTQPPGLDVGLEYINGDWALNHACGL